MTVVGSLKMGPVAHVSSLTFALRLTPHARLLQPHLQSFHLRKLYGSERSFGSFLPYRSKRSHGAQVTPWKRLNSLSLELMALF